MSPGVDVNPQILAWARKRAGFSVREASAKFKIQETRLKRIENGSQGVAVSRTLFKKMTKLYRQPSLVFYLSQPPRSEEYEVRFRKVYESASRQDSILIESLVRDAWARQGIVKSVIESEEEDRFVPFIGSLSTSAGLQKSVGLLMEAIGGIQTINDYHSRTEPGEAFRSVRRNVEKSGVFVILKGDLGSYHSKIPVSSFRGLAISDRVAPFIIINSADSPPARTFTLLHEMVHLLLGESTISREKYSDENIEVFCNRVASSCLLPEKILDDLEFEGSSGTEDQLRSISEFARERNLSSTMVAYRLFLSGKIGRSNFRDLRQTFYDMWTSRKEVAHIPATKSSPSYYVVRRSQIGESLLRFTKQKLETEAISTSKAAKILDVSPINVGKVLNPEKRV